MRKPAAVWLAAMTFAGWVHAQAINPTLPSINTANNFNVTTYGASTANANNASAINSAISAAAAASGGGTVEIPGPGVYLTGPLTMKSKVNLQIDAGAILRMLPYGTWSGTTPLLTSSSVNDVELSGSGAIDGQGGPWWASDPGSGLYMLYFDDCQRVLIENVTVSNAPAQQIVFKGNKTANVTVQGVTITAPDSNASTPSHNTDGIDLVGNICLVQNCFISTGDDNIALGSSSAPTYNTLITNCTFGAGHGVSIGSDTSGGVTNITVMNCSFNNTQNGIRMKSDSGKGGNAQYLYYYNLSMTNIVYAPIVIYSYYNTYGNPTISGITPAVAAGEATASTSGEPIWQNIIISNLTATAGQTGMIWAKLELPATNILLTGLNITAAGSFDLYNIAGVQVVDSKIHVTDGNPTFALCDAQATFSNSVAGASTITFQGDDNNNSLAFYNAPASLSDSAMFDADPITIVSSTVADTTSLTLPSGTPVNFQAGTSAATVAVTGNLALNSTINVTNGPGFAAGNYTLFTYTGTLSGQPVLGATPTGFPGYTYALNTGQGKVTFSASGPSTNSATALQVMLPGQTIQTNGGTATVTGTPAAETVGAPFNVVVNAVNANGELVNNSSPTVNFTSTDGSASLPANGTVTLVNGTATVSVTMNTAGGQRLTATDQANVLTANTSSSVTVKDATPLLKTAPTASAIYNGQTLSASVLSGGVCTNAEGATVPGTFAFTSPGTTPPVGTSSQSVTFTPSNTGGYNSITLTVNVTVDSQSETFVSTTLTTSSNSPWTVPPNVTAIQVQMWGGGGGGGGVSASTSGSYGAGGGGGGGAYTISTLTGLTPGSTIAFSVGAGGTAGPSTGTANGGAGGNTTFAGATTANGGAGGGGTSTAGVAGTAGAGGTASSPGFKGGNGAAGGTTTSGGGGGSAGTNSIGNNASVATGGAAVPGGGAGANGITGSTHANGTNGFNPGGGGSGGFENNGTTLRTGGAGAPGQIIIVNITSPPTPPTLTGVTASGANLIITGENGTAGTCVVLTSTDLGDASWTPVSTNTISAGNFSLTVTNAINSNTAGQFYILRIP